MRFLLDTNVLSELMRTAPDPEVLDWFDQNRNAPMMTSAISQAEILTGIALLPAGKRRTALDEAAQKMFEQDFAERICGFDALPQGLTPRSWRPGPVKAGPSQPKTPR
ncbi:hypothetical protein LP415_23895 [Polaromonas sp. P1(28)-8]|nr:hypothetical protein LP415_23895 [Polaromonas sp. P1(28)-8]